MGQTLHYANKCNKVYFCCQNDYMKSALKCPIPEFQMWPADKMLLTSSFFLSLPFSYPSPSLLSVLPLFHFEIGSQFVFADLTSVPPPPGQFLLFLKKWNHYHLGTNS